MKTILWTLLSVDIATRLPSRTSFAASIDTSLLLASDHDEALVGESCCAALEETCSLEGLLCPTPVILDDNSNNIESDWPDVQLASRVRTRIDKSCEGLLLIPCSGPLAHERVLSVGYTSI